MYAKPSITTKWINTELSRPDLSVNQISIDLIGSRLVNEIFQNTIESFRELRSIFNVFFFFLCF